MPVLMIGQTAIEYEVRRSARCRRKRIVVTPGKVEVVAPAHAPEEEVEGYVHRKRRWIFDKTSEMQERLDSRLRPEHYVTGAKIRFRGRMMKLRVSLDRGQDVRLEYRGGFHVTAPGNLTTEGRDNRIETAMAAWLKRRVLKDAATFVRRYGPPCGLDPKGIRVKEQKHYWGSCGKDGIINLNWRLIAAPKPVLEYVVVHELCHLRHRNHTAAFWRLLGSLLPDYEVRREWLDRQGSGLEL